MNALVCEESADHYTRAGLEVLSRKLPHKTVSVTFLKNQESIKLAVFQAYVIPLFVSTFYILDEVSGSEKDGGCSHLSLCGRRRRSAF